MEAAGIVLAVLPILINGLTGLAQAAGTFDKLRKPSKEYGRYGRSLKRELSIYRNTITELLEGIVNGDDDRQTMMLDPSSSLWNQYEPALRTRLGESYDVFLDTIEEVQEELQILVKKLKLNGRLKDDVGDLPEDFWIREVQRFKMAFNKDAYEEIYNQIQKLNNFLSQTIQQSLRIEEKRGKGKVMTAKYTASLRRLRAQAKNIHTSLTNSLQCNCSFQHSIMLKARPAIREPEDTLKPWRLGISDSQMWIDKKRVYLLELQPNEVSNTTDSPLPTTSSDMKAQIISTSVIARDSKPKKSIRWQASEQTLVDKLVPAMDNRGAVRITDLCSTLLSSTNSTDELGFISGKEDAWRCKVRYHKLEDNPGAESLADLLKLNSAIGSVSKVVFSRRERLAAAATLAMSALFLEGSWLEPVWTNSDVILIRETEPAIQASHGTKLNQDLTFSWIVCASNLADAERENKAKRLKIQGKTAILFALAMALIELSLGQPLEQLKTDNERAEDFVSSNMAAAIRLLHRVHDASGFDYHEVVRKCLYCPFNVPEHSLDDDQFIEIYFQEIAKPLMCDYERFIGAR